MSRIAEIEARLSATSPGPWESSQGANADGKKLATTGAEKAAFLALSINDNDSPLWLVVTPEVIPAATGDGPCAQANAEFIANAPADITFLLAQINSLNAEIKQYAAEDADAFVALSFAERAAKKASA